MPVVTFGDNMVLVRQALKMCLFAVYMFLTKVLRTGYYLLNSLSVKWKKDCWCIVLVHEVEVQSMNNNPNYFYGSRPVKCKLTTAGGQRKKS